jgi:GntR family transcriptional repressor for pyruvate dehydrogenase complex
MTIVRPAALSEQVQRELQASIRALRPGARLPTERALCERFAVSRPVVREAIARLKADGVVETRQGAGAFVPARPVRLSFRFTTDGAVGREDLRHIMELRVAVEVAAAELAAQRRTASDLAAIDEALDAMTVAIRTRTDGSEADDRFHAAIAAATKNPHLGRFVGFLRHQFGVTRRPTWSADGYASGQPGRAQREHARIFAAIRAGNSRAARAAAFAHLMSSAKRLGLIDHRRTTRRRPR